MYSSAELQTALWVDENVMINNNLYINDCLSMLCENVKF